MQESRDLPLPPQAAGSAPTPYVPSGRSVPLRHAFEWLAGGWRIFRRQTFNWVLLALVLGLITIALSVIPGIGQLAVSLLMPVFVGGLMIGCQRAERGEEVELAHLFAGFRRNTGQLVLVALIGIGLMIAIILPAAFLAGMGAMAGMFAGGGPEDMGAGALLAVLFTLALIVPVNMALWFAPALVALQDQPATSAVAQSFRACLKNIAPFLLYGLALFVLAVVATIPFGLGWLVAGPLMVASVYTAYRDIFSA